MYNNKKNITQNKLEILYCFFLAILEILNFSMMMLSRTGISASATKSLFLLNLIVSVVFCPKLRNGTIKLSVKKNRKTSHFSFLFSLLKKDGFKKRKTKYHKYVVNE